MELGLELELGLKAAGTHPAAGKIVAAVHLKQWACLVRVRVRVRRLGG